MVDQTEEWRPGSFTKNFSWGSERGFAQLYDIIRIGFDCKLEDVPRNLFRKRLENLRRPDYIPINFFLFNRIYGNEECLMVDELVFQAITGNHGPRFDKLALFAFNFSHVGIFKRAKKYQRYPARWATAYVRERLAGKYDWDAASVSADDIELFLANDSRWKAEGERKVATNLAHLYKIGRISDLRSERVDRWWVDALFLALDRLIEDRLLSGLATSPSEYLHVLTGSSFKAITGKRSLEKDLAAKHLVRLYSACGGRERFSPEAVSARTQLLASDLQEWAAPNNPDPIGAIHPTNSRILKSIPPTCAMLAIEAGFEILSSMAMDEFDADDFIRENTRAALERLKDMGIQPTMSAEELMKLTRGS